MRGHASAPQAWRRRLPDLPIALRSQVTKGETVSTTSMAAWVALGHVGALGAAGGVILGHARIASEFLGHSWTCVLSPELGGESAGGRRLRRLSDLFVGTHRHWAQQIPWIAWIGEQLPPEAQSALEVEGGGGRLRRLEAAFSPDDVRGEGTARRLRWPTLRLRNGMVTVAMSTSSGVDFGTLTEAVEEGDGGTRAFGPDWRSNHSSCFVLFPPKIAQTALLELCDATSLPPPPPIISAHNGMHWPMIPRADYVYSSILEKSSTVHAQVDRASSHSLAGVWKWVSLTGSRVARRHGTHCHSSKTRCNTRQGTITGGRCLALRFLIRGVTS